MKLTGATILGSRGMKLLQEAPAAYPYRSAAEAEGSPMAADPATADAAAKQRGLPMLDRVRALRAEFGLSLAAAKAVADATDGRPPLFPEVASPEQMEAVLGSELGYCGCATGDALVVLRDLLRAAAERTDATGDPAAFSRASRRLEALLAGGGGWAEWLVYGLEQRDFVWHGFRQVDLWVTDKGRLLLRAVERYGLGSAPDAELFSWSRDLSE